MIAAPNLWKAEDRLQTFQEGWAKHSSVDPKKLTGSGFFYTQTSDQTKCWTCGVLVQGWRIGHDADVVHARLSPACMHLTFTRGKEFVAEYNYKETDCDAASIKCDLTLYTTAKRETGKNQEEGTTFLNEVNIQSGVERTDRISASGEHLQQDLIPTPSEQSSVEQTDIIPVSDKQLTKKQHVSSVRNKSFKIDHKNKCTHCYLNKKDVKLLPCKHQFCGKCAKSMRKCYLCRRTKTNVVVL